MRKFIATSEKIAVKDYPYGFKLRTTLFDEMEFNPKKGYRSVKTTVNPKNGRLNTSKKSTYYELMVRFYDENNHIKTTGFSFNGAKEINRAMQFINENFEMFTKEEIEYFYMQAVVNIKVDAQARVIYSGSKFEELKPLYDEVVKNMVKGVKNPTLNLFNTLLDVEALDSKKDNDYQPFKTTY